MNNELTLWDRFTKFYPDNKDYFNKMCEEYRQERADYLKNGAGKTFAEYETEKYGQVEDAEDVNDDKLNRLKQISRFVKLDYIDSNAEEALVKPLNIGKKMERQTIENYLIGNNAGEGIILPNGDFYQVKGTHNTLLSWLMLNGIDATNGVRVAREHITYNLFYSDMSGYIQDAGAFKITPQQAEGMYNLYLSKKSEKDSFYDTILLSSKAGEFLSLKNREIFYHNTEELKKASEKLYTPGINDRFRDVFDDKTFESELRENQTRNRF